MVLKIKKKLGQNFILNTDITDRIVSYAGNLENYNVIEVGPGLGSLTKSILKCNPKKLIAIEKDRDLIEVHDKIVKNNLQKNYEIIFDDILKINIRDLCSPPVKVISNLPYNISTVLLFKWLNDIEFFTSMTLMFQKEVAERIVAQPNSKSYGKVSILTQLLCNVEKICDFGPDIFFPAPKVESSLVNIFPLSEPRAVVNINNLKKVMNITFGARRKMLRTTLKSILENKKIELKSIGIDDSLRPENLSILQFCNIANLL